jgi:translation initiation factor 3 subunit B
MENGYHVYDFRGEQLREEPIEKFRQWAWRPRPPTLLSKEEQKQVRKNLREYSKTFDQEDAERGASADLAVVEARRQLLDDWLAWRASVEAELEEERLDRGLPLDPVETLQQTAEEGEEQVIEEIMEEVLEETEEIVS